jgi:hypothetical protein
MTIQQRQAAWIQSHGTPWQARKADLYLRHNVSDALACLFTKVCEGR